MSKKIKTFDDITPHDIEAHGNGDILKKQPFWYEIWHPAGFCPTCKAAASHVEVEVLAQENDAVFVRLKSDTDKAI